MSGECLHAPPRPHILQLYFSTENSESSSVQEPQQQGAGTGTKYQNTLYSPDRRETVRLVL